MDKNKNETAYEVSWNGVHLCAPELPVNTSLRPNVIERTDRFRKLIWIWALQTAAEEQVRDRGTGGG